jgi:hypothetical protein
MPPKRGRDPLDDPKSGPSKHQLKGLAYVGKQPSFLRNAAAALSGQTGSSGNRAPIPTRPEGYGDDDQDDAASDRDDWDLDRGDDEAPQVVVLKEGKHIGKDEVDRIRAEGELARTAMLTPGRSLDLVLTFLVRICSQGVQFRGSASHDRYRCGRKGERLARFLYGHFSQDQGRRRRRERRLGRRRQVLARRRRREKVGAFQRQPREETRFQVYRFHRRGQGESGKEKGQGKEEGEEADRLALVRRRVSQSLAPLGGNVRAGPLLYLLCMHSSYLCRSFSS